MEETENQHTEFAVLNEFDAFILSNDLKDRLFLLRMLKSNEALMNELLTSYRRRAEL